MTYHSTQNDSQVMPGCRLIMSGKRSTRRTALVSLKPPWTLPRLALRHLAEWYLLCRVQVEVVLVSANCQKVGAQR